MNEIKFYIKCHNDTGLQYFGRTIKEDLKKYKGSGKYWVSHLKKHSYNVQTMEIGRFKENDSYLIDFALGFSAANNIVLSDDWANLIPENGVNQTGDFNKGTVTVKWADERNDKYLKVKVTDPRYISKELVHIATGYTTVRDEMGKTSRIKCDDEKYLSGELTHFCIGLHRTEEQKLKMKGPRLSVTGSNNPFFGKTHTPEAKVKMRGLRPDFTPGIKGKKHSEKSKVEMKMSWENRKLISCPYCSVKSKNMANMKRHHFENCKKSPNYKPIILKCPHCGKEGTSKMSMSRWHFDNCKNFS